ncbi:MAG: GntR family transcriptional regulator [Pseudomonadota bacterium]
MNGILPANVTPIPLKEEAFRDLERMIVNGDLEPGRWVSETDLVDVSGHTRAPIRSAIQRLADEGLLRIVARRGAQVCPIDHTEQFRSLELRRVVERLVVRSAAERATKQQRAELLEIADGFLEVCQTGNQVEMTELDARSFAVLIAAADNKFAARSLTSVKGLSRRFWVLNQERYGDLSRMAHGHAGVARAVGQGDADLAEAAVNALIDYVEEFTLAVVGFRALKA